MGGAPPRAMATVKAPSSTNLNVCGIDTTSAGSFPARGRADCSGLRSKGSDPSDTKKLASSAETPMTGAIALVLESIISNFP